MATPLLNEALDPLGDLVNGVGPSTVPVRSTTTLSRFVLTPQPMSDEALAVEYEKAFQNLSETVSFLDERSSWYGRLAMYHHVNRPWADLPPCIQTSVIRYFNCASVEQGELAWIRLLQWTARRRSVGISERGVGDPPPEFGVIELSDEWVRDHQPNLSEQRLKYEAYQMGKMMVYISPKLQPTEPDFPALNDEDLALLAEWDETIATFDERLGLEVSVTAPEKPDGPSTAPGTVIDLTSPSPPPDLHQSPADLGQPATPSANPATADAMTSFAEALTLHFQEDPASMAALAELSQPHGHISLDVEAETLQWLDGLGSATTLVPEIQPSSSTMIHQDTTCFTSDTILSIPAPVQPTTIPQAALYTVQAPNNGSCITEPYLLYAGAPDFRPGFAAPVVSQPPTLSWPMELLSQPNQVVYTSPGVVKSEHQPMLPRHTQQLAQWQGMPAAQPVLSAPVRQMAAPVPPVAPLGNSLVPQQHYQVTAEDTERVSLKRKLAELEEGKLKAAQVAEAKRIKRNQQSMLARKRRVAKQKAEAAARLLAENEVNEGSSALYSDQHGPARTRLASPFTPLPRAEVGNTAAHYPSTYMDTPPSRSQAHNPPFIPANNQLAYRYSEATLVPQSQPHLYSLDPCYLGQYQSGGKQDIQQSFYTASPASQGGTAVPVPCHTTGAVGQYQVQFHNPPQTLAPESADWSAATYDSMFFQQAQQLDSQQQQAAIPSWQRSQILEQHRQLQHDQQKALGAGYISPQLHSGPQGGRPTAAPRTYPTPPHSFPESRRQSTISPNSDSDTSQGGPQLQTFPLHLPQSQSQESILSLDTSWHSKLSQQWPDPHTPTAQPTPGM